MLSRRVSKFKKAAPPPSEQVLFDDDLALQVGARFLETFDSSTSFGNGYSLLQASNGDIGLRTHNTDGYAVNSGGLGQDRGNILDPDPALTWGTGYHAVSARIYSTSNAAATARFAMHARTEQNDLALTTKNGINLLWENLWNTVGMRVRITSREDTINLLYDSTWINLTFAAVTWWRLETEVVGVNTVRIAAAYSTLSGFSTNPADWTVLVAPVTVPIYSDANSLAAVVLRSRDDINNLRLRFTRVDTFRLLGV